MIRSLDAQMPVVIDGPAGRATLEPPDAIHLLGAARNAKVFIDSPNYCCSEVCVSTLVKLIAFIDCGMRVHDVARPIASQVVSSVFVARGFTAPDTDVIQREFIGRVLAGDGIDESLFNFLRTAEGYWVVSFLLDQFAANRRVSDLGAQYGLSNAHFRRLCKVALGGSLKAELKRWRAASAVLRIVESEQTLTDIALEAGFASSSHLSREIKSLLGVPPSHIWHFGLGRLGGKERIGEEIGDACVCRSAFADFVQSDLRLSLRR
ncbi:helix-turn-helix domain-containing protein [Pararobbsia alpina]|uniref:helix-turn-helix domain-containing protein n=1 Tax=Pararobbsia alpina TaxID=621374 RepID=UPI001583BEF6|nr:helix-turn-helix domain-containing protein [Pararobbsia alpina]